MAHKAGFVNIIGFPNAGKSTLMNVLVDEKLSVITSKAQTTRHRIAGILNAEDYQVVFSDTPGILDPKYKLQEKMLREIYGAFEDADVLILLLSLDDEAEPDPELIRKIRLLTIPVFAVINKIDLGDEAKLNSWNAFVSEHLPDARLFHVSALHGLYLDNLLEKIVEALPENPPYYDKDALTDKTERFFVTEIIREKILLFYQKEIPYSVDVQIDEFKEGTEIHRIRALIFVEKESQKAILIGDKGKAIKRLGTEARKDIEAFLQKKIYLELVVKVSKNWRHKEDTLRFFGY